MLNYLDQNALEPELISRKNFDALKHAVWIDLISPTKAEENEIEQLMGQNLPTHEEMVEIELSSRLYKEKDTLFMTATMIAQSESNDPQLEPVTFVLTPNQLITLRYIDPHAFKLFISHLKKIDISHRRDPTLLLIELLDTTIDRLADILEHVGIALESHSKMIFQQVQKTKVKLNYEDIMNKIGASANLNTKACESLMTFNRLISFFLQALNSNTNPEGLLRLISLGKDVNSLSDHANFLSNKINFLLDATLGMVNIEQNNIIKLFSVAAVIFLPPYPGRKHLWHEL
ncbi:MAG: CorA family divalent cation transporter [Legionellaceae bacterium]